MRNSDWLLAIDRAVKGRDGTWRIWTPALEMPGASSPQEGPLDRRYYLQKKRMEQQSWGKQMAWESDPEPGFATLDDLASYLGVGPEADYTKRTKSDNAARYAP